MKARYQISQMESAAVIVPVKSQINPPPSIPTGAGIACTCGGKSPHHHGEYHHLSFAIRAGKLPGDVFSKERLAQVEVDYDAGDPLPADGFVSVIDKNRVTGRAIPSDGPKIITTGEVEQIERIRARKSKKKAT